MTNKDFNKIIVKYDNINNFYAVHDLNNPPHEKYGIYYKDSTTQDIKLAYTLSFKIWADKEVGELNEFDTNEYYVEKISDIENPVISNPTLDYSINGQIISMNVSQYLDYISKQIGFNNFTELHDNNYKIAGFDDITPDIIKEIESEQYL